MTTKYRIRSWLGLIALLFASISATISAAEFFVSTTGNDTNVGSRQSPVATIQRGIALASNGDTVWINPGTYSGVGNRAVSLQGKTVAVRSMGGPSITILDLDRQKGFIASTSETLNTIIQGFTITNGYVSSGADWTGTGIIDMTNSAVLTIRDCVFRNNEVKATYLTTNSQIVSKFGTGKALVRNCLFYNNVCYGGAWMGTSFSRIVGVYADVNECTIANNQLTSYNSAGGSPIYANPGTTKNTIVWGNTAPSSGVGIETSEFSYSISDTNPSTNASVIDVINENPKFVDSSSGNYALSAGSPAVDAGDPSATDPDGSRVDIGFRLDRFVGFVTTYTLTVQGVSTGSITGSGQYLSGSTATLTAIPYPGYVFTGWTGSATGTTNPMSIVMDSNKTVGATFAPDLTDNDTDGLTTYDEVVTYGTDPTKDDTDGDGLKDGLEVGVGRFSIIGGNFTWGQARADAHARGGELACIPTTDRLNRMMESLGANALDSYTGLWIGASDATTEGTWSWVNSETFSYTNWGTGRPGATPGNTLDYAEVSGGGGSEIGKWYDRSGTTIRDGYILETGYATDPKVADADGDGLNDGAEQAAGTNPFMADTDGDGLSDEQEVNLTHTYPKLADSNGNGTSDSLEDPDGDGMTNLAEVTQHGTNPLLDDTDSDGVKDGTEVNYVGSFYNIVQGSFTYQQAMADAAAKRGRVASFPDAKDYSRMASKARQATQGYLWIGLSDAATEGTWVWTNGTTATYSRWLTGQPSGGTSENHVAIMENSTHWADAAENYVAAGYIFERVGLDPLDPDTDTDGLTDGQEINTIHSRPVLDDTDGDGLLDGAEVNTHGSSPLLADTDADGINDRVEVEVYHTNPSLKDSDGDGFDDLFEVNTGFDPALATSTPDALSTIRTAVEFRFNAANGVSYRIEASTDLTQWDIIEPVIIGESAVVTRFYSIENQPNRYFRVRRN